MDRRLATSASAPRLSCAPSRALGPLASPPDADLRRPAAAARKGTSSPSARRTRDSSSGIMKNWLRWAPRHPQPSAYRLPPPPGRARPGPLNAARPQGRLLLRSVPRPDQRHAHGPAPCGLGCRPPLDGTPSRALCTGPSGIVSRRLLAPPCGRRFQRHQLAVRATHPGHHPRHHGGLVVHQHVARPLASASPGPCSRPYHGPLSKNRAVHLSSTPRQAAATHAPLAHGLTYARPQTPYL